MLWFSCRPSPPLTWVCHHGRVGKPRLGARLASCLVDHQGAAVNFLPDCLAVVERFLSHSVSTGRYCPQALAERQTDLRAFARHLARPPGDCCADDLAAWIDSNPDWKASSTKRAKCAHVQTCFNWAARVGRLGANPFLGVAYDEGERRRATTDDLFDRAMQWADIGFQEMLLFLRATGCRPGEARAAQWQEVNWERRCIVLERHKSRKKTKKPRVIPLPPDAYNLLLSMRMVCDGTGAIFRNGAGGPWKKPALVQKWARLRTRAGIPKWATLHGIRHQAATQAVRQGGNLKLVSLGLGHASVAITERYYLALDNDVEAMSREMAKGRRQG